MIFAYEGKPGEGMQLRNQAQWMSVADFLTRQNLHLVLQAREREASAQAQAAAGQRSAAAAALGAAQTLPVGNHGEIVAKGVGA
ncbi:hypothetical protein N5C67_25110 [Comamonas thiooxydans]|uniref:hypothetical protein n=1 Tax=Comamonas thiooxydans TaxID=363952 RepID=UPI0024493EED|nr:hypothetical protein [Comamonas thiooxydans]MDH1255923.1 hypothetical protein [Comamonas thiooxydans]